MINGKQQAWTNIGLYVGLAGELAAGFPCSGSTIRIEGNQVNWTNKNGIKNGWYNCSCCPGVVLVNNNFNAPITSSVLPASLSLNSTACGSSPANILPVVSITAPANSANFNAPASIAITAAASDADGTISKVEFYNGTTLIGSDLSSPYAYTWSNVVAGSYTITAKAYDNTGAVSTSTAIAITVKTVTKPNVAPVVSLTSPLTSTSYTAPASVTISANASDADGTISKVEFYNGATLLGSDLSSPYSYTWSNVAAGSYNIIAKAYDNLNAVTTSAASVISVVTAPASSSQGLNGPSCITAGQSYAYTAVPESDKFTNLSFWSNSAATIIQDAVAKRKITIQVPSNMTGTSFTLSVGVNYSVSPWYKEYTKVVKVGGCSSRINASVSPQPTESTAAIQLENDQKIIFVVVYNELGQEVYRADKIDSETFELGAGIAPGLYNVIIHSEEGTTNTRFMKK